MEKQKDVWWEVELPNDSDKDGERNVSHKRKGSSQEEDP